MADERSQGLVRRAHDVVTQRGTARSTRSVGFDGDVMHWGDLPAETRKQASHRSPVVADLAVIDGALYRSGADRVQVLRGWRAHRDRVYVAVAERPVHAGEAGPTPAGSWRHVHVQRYDVDGAAQRRVGWVAAGQDVVPPDGVPRGGPPAPAASPDHARAAQAWPFLPSAVRDGAVRTVPVPEDWLGELTQLAGLDGFATSQEILVLRRDERTALVVRARRELVPTPGRTAEEHALALAGADWLVEQVTYRLRRREALPRTRALGLPW